MLLAPKAVVRGLVGALAVCLLPEGVARAAEVAELRMGAKVRVTTNEELAGSGGTTPFQGPLVGRIVAIERDTITISRHERERFRLKKEAITKLEIRKGHGRGKNALIGAGAGLAIGLVWATIEHSRCKGEFLCDLAFTIPVLTTPVGAVVGVAVPGNHRWVDKSPSTLTQSRGGAKVAMGFRLAF